MRVEVGEFFSVDYPTLEGGFAEEVDDLSAFLEELRGEYAEVDEPRLVRGTWTVRVYEG